MSWTNPDYYVIRPAIRYEVLHRREDGSTFSLDRFYETEERAQRGVARMIRRWREIYATSPGFEHLATEMSEQMAAAAGMAVDEK